MKLLKKIFPLILIVPALASCSPSEEGMICLSNAKYFFNENVNGDSKLLTGTIENVKTLMDLDIPFVVYFHKEDCSWCEKFAPIMEDYLSNYETLVVDVPYEILNSFVSEFGTYYFSDEKISFPYVGIAKGYENCRRVENKKYMQTKSAFKNYMASELKNSQIYYADSTIEHCKNIREFTYISLKNTDKTALNLYSTKVQEIAIDSSKNIVISSKDSTGLDLMKIGASFEVKEKAQISEETEPDLINNFF